MAAARRPSAPCPICKRRHVDGDAAAIARLAATPARLAALIGGLDAKGLARTYGPGKWTMRQIACHLRDCEIVYSTRWRLMLAESRPPIPAFEQDRWASATRYAKQDAARAVATFTALRASNLELVALAGRGALSRVGVHPEYGPITLAQFLRHTAAHDENHLVHLATARVNRKR